MKLIIDIPDKDYEKLKDGHIPFSILDVMQNGIPISDGITRKELHHLLFHIDPPELDSPYMSCANANGGKGCESCKHKDDLNCDKNWWNAPWEGGERMRFCIRPSVCKKCGKPLTLFEGWHCFECEAKEHTSDKLCAIRAEIDIMADLSAKTNDKTLFGGLELALGIIDKHIGESEG